MSLKSNDRKKVLFVCQYFYPETFRGNDVAFHLSDQGHEVHVVTGIPNYPEGKFYQGYGLFKKRHEVVRSVKVTRLPIVPRGKNNKILLLLNYFSYFISASIWMLFHAIFHKYDIVFCQQLSPVMMSAPAIIYKRLRKVPLYTWVLDLWPESLSVAGGVNNKYILGFFNLFVKSEYKHSDVIFTSSKSFEQSILSYGDYKSKIRYFPQWSDGLEENIMPSQTVSLPPIPSGFVVMFAGAVGEAHGMECNMRAALLTREYKNIHWVIVGDGRKLSWLKEYVLENKLEETVHLLGRYPSDMMPMFFQQADVMLVSLKDDSLLNMYAPAKISSYMAASRPIIAVLNGEGGDIVRDAGCGWNVEAGDSEGLARIVIELSESAKELLDEKGTSGLKYYKDFFEKEKCLAKLDQIIFGR